MGVNKTLSLITSTRVREFLMGWAEEKEKEDMFNKHCKKVALIMALSMMTSVTAFAEKKIFNFKTKEN